MKKILVLVLLISGFLNSKEIKAQVWDPGQGCLVGSNGECLPNTQLSALPFLRIVPDSRSGALGDAGIAISPDANAMHFNASKLAFAEKDMSISATYTPWLQNLGIQDVYLAYLSAYRKLDDNQALGASLRFFSLGEIQFRDASGGDNGKGRPREYEFALAYARKLGESFSASLTAKYIYSNLAGGQMVGSSTIFAANSFAVDLGLNYGHKINLGDYDGRMRYGLAITNIGAKVSYTKAADSPRDFIPTNLGLGTALEMDLDKYNTLMFTIDMNKLMIPTPTRDSLGIIDETGLPGVADYRELALLEGMIGSFSDAPGGFTEELQELNFSFGLEYWYAKQFAVRTGYYYEHRRKGDRKFFTAGLGIKYNVFEMNISYLIPTNNKQNPLDNTLRFSLIFNIGEDPIEAQ